MAAPELERVLVVTAHPDDVDFAAVGTVATLTAQGVAVSYCIATDGDAGGFDPTVDRAEIPRIRRGEQTEAARLAGVADIHWLAFPDGRLEPDLGLRRAIARVIRKVRPQRVIAQNPARNWDSVYGSHPDHMATGEATLRAVYPDARNPWAFPELLAEGLDAHAADEVWVMGGPAADQFVDVTDRFATKLAALRAHVSQETDRHGRLEPLLQRWMGATAEAAGFAPGRLAEGFRRLDTR
jgi:LmbE family N-acetylglucosaminyl deacetylase